MSEKKTAKKEKIQDWRVLEFFVPIEESLTDNENFLIRGVAINETTTLNNVKYIAEELEKAAPTFRNVPILLDHKNEVKNIVGRTTENVSWNPTYKRIEFEAKIMDKDIQERIKDGRIGSVSIGAKVQDLTEESDGSMKALGIKGLEISLVAVPGDSNANLAQAIQQSLHLKEMAQLCEEELKKEETDMSEEEQKTEEVETKEEEEKPEEKVEVAEEKAQNINVKVDTTEISDMKKQISEIAELLKVKKKIQEELEMEKEDETKGKVSTEKEEALESVESRIVESLGGNKFAMYRDYSKESADTKLKRLIR